MTLGCGGYGGNITSDNISPRHLLNIKRLAYELDAGRQPLGSRRGRRPTARAPRPTRRPAARACQAPRRNRPRLAGISADALSRRIDEFLGVARLQARTGDRAARPAQVGPAIQPGQPRQTATPLDFVCEEDVRLAIQAGRKLVVSERAIVTPAARDLGEAQPRLLRRALARHRDS